MKTLKHRLLLIMSLVGLSLTPWAQAEDAQPVANAAQNTAEVSLAKDDNKRENKNQAENESEPQTAKLQGPQKRIVINDLEELQ